MGEETYTLKELMQELRTETKQQSSALSRIENHLSTLNSKVAAHELLHQDHTKKLESLGNLKSQAMLVWGIAVFILTTAVNKFL